MFVGKEEALQRVRRDHAYLFTPDDELVAQIEARQKTRKLNAGEKQFVERHRRKIDRREELVNRMLKRENVRRLLEMHKGRKKRASIEERAARIERIAAMRRGDNGEPMSYSAIGKVEGVSRERIRQLLELVGMCGSLPRDTSPLEKICTKCGTGFRLPRSISNMRRRACDGCLPANNRRFGKKMKDWTKDEWRIYNKDRNDATREYRLAYYRNNKDKILARRHAPENAAKYRAYARKYYQKKRESEPKP